MNERRIRRKIGQKNPCNTDEIDFYQKHVINGAPQALFGQILIDTFNLLDQLKTIHSKKKNPNPELIETLEQSKKRYEEQYKKTAKNFQQFCEKYGEQALHVLFESLCYLPNSEACEHIIAHTGEEALKDIQHKVTAGLEHNIFQTSETLRSYSQNELVILLASADVLTIIQNDGLIEQFFIQFLKAHLRKTELRMKEMTNELPELCAQASAHIVHAIEKGLIPIPQDVFHKRMKNLLIVPTDPIVAEMEENSGKYLHYAHAILLPTSLQPDDMMHALVHEIYHAQSGQLIYMTEQDGRSPSRAIVKSGGRFLPQEENATLMPRLQWLDEACVELSVMATLHITDPAYPNEIALVQKFIALGIPQLSFLKMVFESAASRQIQGKKVSSLPHTRDLFKAVDQKLYWGFLSDLDLIIRYDCDSAELAERPMTDGVKYVLQNWTDNKETVCTWVKESAAAIKALYRANKGKRSATEPVAALDK